jgi:hypothetical protein
VALRVVAGSSGDDGICPAANRSVCRSGRHGEEPTHHGTADADIAQRDDALRKAQAARLARKQLLTAIAAGEQTIPAVLDRAKTDTIIGRTKVADLLKSLPGYGPAKVTALMERTGIVSSREPPAWRASTSSADRRADIAALFRTAGPTHSNRRMMEKRSHSRAFHVVFGLITLARAVRAGQRGVAGPVMSDYVKLAGTATPHRRHRVTAPAGGRPAPRRDR